jgi:hypothetical protein
MQIVTAVTDVKSTRTSCLELQAVPHNACTRLVGVAAFSGSLLGLKPVPAEWRPLVPPTSG